MFEPNHIVTFAGEGIRLLCRRYENMNGMLRSKAFDNLNGWNHVTISRNNNGDVTALGLRKP